jgi:hypothetical protein
MGAVRRVGLTPELVSKEMLEYFIQMKLGWGPHFEKPSVP